MRARQAPAGSGAWRERRRRLPFTPPVSLVNGLSLRPFNALYYNINRRRTGVRIVHYEPFLYPLDSILDWNRLYGPSGFFQYQSVVPSEAGLWAAREMLDAIQRSGPGSFLAVLKTFGAPSPAGPLGFPPPRGARALGFRDNRTPPALFLP